MIFSISNLPKDHYVYAYLREDATPYYIGKGINKRAWYHLRGDVMPPTDRGKIKIIAHRLTHAEALLLEKKLITAYGRKDLGTGILRNKTNGGDGMAGVIFSDETLAKRAETRKKNNKPNPAKGRKMVSLTCPVCGLVGAGAAMTRYHFSNCGKPKPPQKQTCCAVCGVTGTVPNIAKYHNKNCKIK